MTCAACAGTGHQPLPPQHNHTTIDDETGLPDPAAGRVCRFDDLKRGLEKHRDAAAQERGAAAKAKLVAAYKAELATFTWGTLVMPTLLPGEVGGDAAHVRVCCDKDPFKAPPANFTCDCDGPPYSGPTDTLFGHC